MRRTGLLGKIRNIFSEESREKRREWLKSKTEMPRWKIRRKFWNGWAWFKFVTKRPMKISLPTRRKDRLELVEITEMIKGLDDLKENRENTPYRVPNRIPSDEKPFLKYWVKMAIFSFQAMLCRTKWFSPMQNGLPSIHGDPQWALDDAYSERGESLWPRPKLPPALYDSPDLKSLDLGILAVEGPYAGYLEKVKNQEGVYQWNLLKLGDYQTHPGLYRLGVRVEFQVGSQLIPWGSDSKPFFPLRAVKIEFEPAPGGRNPELPPSVDPGDEKWGLAKKIALCALTNHTSIIRHWSWIHLIPATQLAFATRTKLGPDHPLRRLLWPHIYGTVQATKFGSMAQMAKGGDFENVFSFPQKEMCKLFHDSYKDFRLCKIVPELDLEARGIGSKGGKVEFSMPTHENLNELFNIIQKNVGAYLGICYPDGDSISKDDELVSWLKTLHTGLPGGILEVLKNEVLDETIRTKKEQPKEADIQLKNVTLDNVARLVASFIYLGSVQHEMMGSLFWNYQLWTHKQPTRVYKNGGREPLDVYQRLVNYNFMLMVKRASLIDESIYRRMTKGLPKEEKGKLEKWYGQFVAELAELQSTMAAEPWEAWRIYPKELEAHINA